MLAFQAFADRSALVYRWKEGRLQCVGLIRCIRTRLTRCSLATAKIEGADIDDDDEEDADAPENPVEEDEEKDEDDDEEEDDGESRSALTRRRS